MGNIAADIDTIAGHYLSPLPVPRLVATLPTNSRWLFEDSYRPILSGKDRITHQVREDTVYTLSPMLGATSPLSFIESCFA